MTMVTGMTDEQPTSMKVVSRADLLAMRTFHVNGVGDLRVSFLESPIWKLQEALVSNTDDRDVLNQLLAEAIQSPQLASQTIRRWTDDQVLSGAAGWMTRVARDCSITSDLSVSEMRHQVDIELRRSLESRVDLGKRAIDALSSSLLCKADAQLGMFGNAVIDPIMPQLAVSDSILNGVYSRLAGDIQNRMSVLTRLPLESVEIIPRNVLEGFSSNIGSLINSLASVSGMIGQS